MRRRNFYRPDRNIKTKTLNNASPDECRIFAYYLYEICKYKHDFYQDDEDDDAFMQYAHQFFVKLAKKLDVEQAVELSLEKTIENYVKYEKLHPFQDNHAEPERFFSDTDVRYKFTEDYEVERLRPVDCDSLIHVNLVRCFYASQSNEFFLSLIANYLSFHPLWASATNVRHCFSLLQ